MDAPPIQLAPTIRPFADRTAERLASGLGALLIVAMTLAALVLFARRLAGGLSEPLLPSALIATGLIVASAAAGARWLIWGANRRPADRRVDLLVSWLPGLAIVALAAGISLPGSSPSALIVLWLAIIAEELWIWRQARVARNCPAVKERRIAPESALPPRTEVLEPIQPTIAPITEVPAASSDVVQRLVRTQSAAGIDRIHGWLKAALEPGERNATLHVAFCPPFAELPTLTVLQISGPSTRIKPVQLLPYGVRLELKRQLASHDPAAVVIEFSAEAPLRPAISPSASQIPSPLTP